MKKIYFTVMMILMSSQFYCMDVEASLQQLDLTSIDRLQGQLRQYRENDGHLRELHDVLSTQKGQLIEYNRLLDNLSVGNLELNLEQQAVIKRQSFQDLIQVSKTEIDSLSQLSGIIMQSKNIDPSWQIQKHGKVLGSLYFVKNLMIPRDVQSYMYAGVGAVTGLAILKSLPKTSPTIQINVPVGATNITIQDDSQQKIVATVGVCALGAGSIVAGTQLYNSWMHEKSSRDALTDKIKAIKNSNAQVGAAFDTIGLHKALVRQEQAIGIIDNRIAQVQADVSIVNNGIVQLQQGAVQDRNAALVRHDEVNGHFDQVSNQCGELNQKIDTLMYDQQKFQQFVTALVTDADTKSECRHTEITQGLATIHKNAAAFRDETARGYNNLDTKLTGITQGQSRLENLIISSQASNRSQLPYSYSKFGGYAQIAVQNFNLNHVDTGSTLEEIY